MNVNTVLLAAVKSAGVTLSQSQLDNLTKAFELKAKELKSERSARRIRASEAATKALKGENRAKLCIELSDTLIIMLDAHGNMSASIVKDAAPMVPIGFSVRREKFAELIKAGAKLSADKRDEDQKAACAWAQAAYPGKSFSDVVTIMNGHGGTKNGKAKDEDDD